MGYVGQTFRIGCERGGFSHNPNIDAGQPTDMVSPSRNINYEENGRRKRGGTSHLYGAAISGTPEIMGLYDFTLRDSTNHVIIATNAGKVYRDNTNTIKASGMSTSNFFDFETFDNELYIADGENTPEKWTGSGNTSTLTDIPSDWTGSNFPQQLIAHGRGASRRLWALGCPTTQHTIYASANGDGDDFSDANVTTINIETGDGFGIVGGIEFGDRLIAFGKNRTYVVDDLDPNTANWGYQEAQWFGGVANFRLLCRTPNDVIAMTEDGNIYSVTSAEQYGDYLAASLSRPAFINEYIKNDINLAQMSKFHMIYDPTLRAVRVFVVRSGNAGNTVDTCLMYYIDRDPKEAWTIHGNWTNASGFDASSAAVFRTGVGDWEVYSGDYGGNVWKLEQANRSDNNQAYYGGFRTPIMNLDDPRKKKQIKRVWTVTKPEGAWDISLDWWVDGAVGTTKAISLAGAGAVLGSFTLGTSLLGGNDLINTAVDLGNIGTRLQLEFYNSTVNQDFFISQVLIDYKPLGAEPA